MWLITSRLFTRFKSTKKYGQTAQQINAIEPRPSPPKCITWLLFHRFARHE
jgi:hypothetical protein